MRRSRWPTLAAILAVGLSTGVTATPGVAQVATTTAQSSCQLNSAGGQIKHVVYLQFDNTHYMRDNSSVASDLEQMPHLLNFLTTNGTLFTNDHTILISHTAGGILSTMTGLYPDRMGVTVSNTYFYQSSPSKVPTFSTAFKYWTDLVDDATQVKDPFPNMITDSQKTTPAPWVPFTRAGCDFGAVSLANIELENTGTGPYGDMSMAFGNGSPEWNDAVTANAAASGTAARAKALTDYVGIAIHCATGGGICASNRTNIANSRQDMLPDEPGTYIGYQALYGAKYVNPAINPPNDYVNNMFGDPVTDPFGHPGFPGFDGATAANTLGYLAQMQESGIPITYGYISDVHDNHTSAFPAPFNANYPRASGPGEKDSVDALKSYDLAFQLFFDRLAADGIDKTNTMFVVTVDEGDRYAGGIGIPQSDGTLGYAHSNCSWPTTPSCPSNQIGEINLNIKQKLPVSSPTFSVHRDSAPTFYVNGQPGRTDSALRTLERNVAALNAIDPYVTSAPAPVFVQMADEVGQKTLHMVNADPARTPSFTAFGNPDYFITDAGPSCGSNPCIDYHFAWSHGDVQPEIATTWVGFVGPGFANNGIDSSTWTDHVNVRPTMMTLLGLKDEYRHDGRVLTEALVKHAIPQKLFEHRNTTNELGAVYEQLNAPFGQFGTDTLTASTRGIISTNDSVYTSIEDSILDLTAQRDSLALKIETALDGAAFDNKEIKEKDAKDWIAQSRSLLTQAAVLAAA
jgi:hypothetical protein